MTLSDHQLLDLAESALMIPPSLPGRSDPLGVDGVMARISSVDHPLANLVTYARLDADSADAVIDEVLARYDTRKRPMAWVVGPLSQPDDLSDRLTNRGFEEHGGMDALILRDLGHDIQSNDAVTIRELQPGESSHHQAMMAESYGIPEDLVALFNDSYASTTDNPRNRSYVAEVDGAPVSWGFSVYIPSTSVVLLGGAGTSAEHRGKGIYTSLVARRLADARADGMDTALIQAVSDTSSPICRRLGFEEIGVLRLFIRPAAA